MPSSNNPTNNPMQPRSNSNTRRISKQVPTDQDSKRKKISLPTSSISVKRTVRNRATQKDAKDSRHIDRSIPLWKGPHKDGVTNSLLTKFIECRERFRLLVVHGLKPDMGYNKSIEYGNMWHLCEEVVANGDNWKSALENHRDKLLLEHSTAHHETINLQYLMCQKHFNLMLTRKKPSEDIVLLSEVSFNCKLNLPGVEKPVILRGKIDKVTIDRFGEITITDHKTKGDLPSITFNKTLTYDMQLSTYAIAFNQMLKDGSLPLEKKLPRNAYLGRFVYNMIRYPLGGRHPPYRRKLETIESFVSRVFSKIVVVPEDYCRLVNIRVDQGKLAEYFKLTMNPLLQQLVEWWKAVEKNPLKPETYLHYRTPFGIYSTLWDGRSGDYFEYLTEGHSNGLVQTDNLFPELT